MWEESKRVEARKTLSKIKIINLILCHLNVGIPLAHCLTQNKAKGAPITLVDLSQLTRVFYTHQSRPNRDVAIVDK